VVFDEIGVHAFADTAWRRLDRHHADQVVAFDSTAVDGQVPVIDLR
jgi:hypothetical protein